MLAASAAAGQAPKFFFLFFFILFLFLVLLVFLLSAACLNLKQTFGRPFWRSWFVSAGRRRCPWRLLAPAASSSGRRLGYSSWWPRRPMEQLDERSRAKKTRGGQLIKFGRRGAGSESNLKETSERRQTSARRHTAASAFAHFRPAAAAAAEAKLSCAQCTASSPIGAIVRHGLWPVLARLYDVCDCAIIGHFRPSVAAAAHRTCDQVWPLSYTNRTNLSYARTQVRRVPKECIALCVLVAFVVCRRRRVFKSFARIICLF